LQFSIIAAIALNFLGKNPPTAIASGANGPFFDYYSITFIEGVIILLY